MQKGQEDDAAEALTEPQQQVLVLEGKGVCHWRGVK